MDIPQRVKLYIDFHEVKIYISFVNMDLNELKKIVRRLGSIIVFDNNKPELIILPYDKISGVNGEESFNQGESEEIEKLNNEILALQNELEEREREIQSRVD